MCFTKTWHGGEDPAAEHESTDSIIARAEVQRWLLEMSSSVLISDSDSERDEYHCKHIAKTSKYHKVFGIIIILVSKHLRTRYLDV